jgi:flagellar basal-body rod modification protein FlgD
MSVGAVAGAGNDTSSTKDLFSSSQNDLGKDAFLDLLVAQLSHQDPLEPMENEEFIAQMATFSQLEQAINLNDNFEAFMKGQSLANYASLMGKEVTALDTDGETELTGTVESLVLENGKTYISVNDKTLPVENIIKINNPKSI